MKNYILATSLLIVASLALLAGCVVSERPARPVTGVKPAPPSGALPPAPVLSWSNYVFTLTYNGPGTPTAYNFYRVNMNGGDPTDEFGTYTIDQSSPANTYNDTWINDNWVKGTVIVGGKESPFSNALPGKF